MTSKNAESRAVPAEVRAAEGFDPGRSAGLFVGVSQFDDPRFAEVPFAVDDAVDLAHLFAIELRLVAPENVFLALSGEPQKDESAARFKSLLDRGAERRRAHQTEIYSLLDAQRRAYLSRRCRPPLATPTQWRFTIWCLGGHTR